MGSRCASGASASALAAFGSCAGASGSAAAHSRAAPSQSPESWLSSASSIPNALGRRQELPQTIERRQDALEPEERREVGRIGPQGREIHGRSLLVLAGALELEALADRLGRQRANREECHRAQDQQRRDPPCNARLKPRLNATGAHSASGNTRAPGDARRG